MIAASEEASDASELELVGSTGAEDGAQVLEIIDTGACSEPFVVELDASEKVALAELGSFEGAAVLIPQLQLLSSILIYEIDVDV